MEKEARERRILERVYASWPHGQLLHRDAPDFLLINSGREATRFGVEVTELYPTSADARIAYHPEYVARLLSGGRHMHRDDLNEMPVSRVDISDPQGNIKYKNVPAIVRPIPGRGDRLNRLTGTLVAKAKKYRYYQVEKLTHVNLIVADFYSYPTPLGAEYSSDRFLNEEVRQSLIESPFRETYLIEEVDESALVIPLQLLLLLEVFYMTIAAMRKLDESGSRTFSDSESWAAFVGYARSLGMNVGMHCSDNSDWVVYRQYAMTVKADMTLAIRDHRDYLLPFVPADPIDLVDARTLNEMATAYRQIQNESTFFCGIWLPKEFL